MLQVIAGILILAAIAMITVFIWMRIMSKTRPVKIPASCPGEPIPESCRTCRYLVALSEEYRCSRPGLGDEKPDEAKERSREA